MDLKNITDLTPELASLIVEHLDGVVVTDSEGRYVYVNEAWSEMMGGVKLEDVKGKFVRDIIPETKIHIVLQTKQPVTGHVIISKGPQKTEAFSSYMPIFKDGELVAGFVHVIMRGMKSAMDFSSRVNKMMDQLEYYKGELRKIRGAKYSIDNIIGESPEIMKMKELIHNAANSNSTVLIEGETGTGKELVAHSVHDLSSRSFGPFIKANCAAIPSGLLESEFFGYEEGAFTGAKKGGKMGKFEMANGSSLFLDEINHLPIELQPKLLRTLQEKEIERVGSTGTIPVNVRIIAASNVPLDKMVKEKTFRSDLFYRINVIRIVIPPLRKRKEDIPLLADNLLERLNFELGMSVPSISAEAKRRLMGYDWPGNVRELQNVIERAMNISRGRILEWEHFKNYFDNKAINDGLIEETSEFSLKKLKDDLEKRTIIKVLEVCEDNKSQAAKLLGILRTMLYRKLEKYAIE